MANLRISSRRYNTTISRFVFSAQICLVFLNHALTLILSPFHGKTGNFDISVARFYAAELVLCLEYLHTKVNVIHRDLKPENVLLSEKMHIKVTDFGTAKRLQENETRVRTGSFLGTAEYIAPECLAEEPEVSRASDLWALGCIIFQMLAGYPPFHGDTQFLTFEQVKKAKISFPPHFPFSAKKLIKKLCHRSPERRLGYASYDKLKAHEFFDGVEWEGLFESEAPKVIANPEYSLTELSRSKWENIIGTSATVLEYGEITWHRENKASKTAFLLLTASAALVLNSSQTKILKSFEPAANSVLQAHPDYSNQFSWMVKDAEKAVLTFDDISDFDPARWTKAFKKLGE